MPNRFETVDLETLGQTSERPKFSPEQVVKRIERGREQFEKRKNSLILNAILKHIEAISYRGFRVGSSVIAVNSHVDGGFVEESAHNFKPREHQQNAWDKLCA
ncbi:MAG: hypothetical protein P4L74_01395 [Candidatus Doudnabacteria bacterium]|nr:hypothetical protein [Candidatus Doudnabacteria bacterium]